MKNKIKKYIQLISYLMVLTIFVGCVGDVFDEVGYHKRKLPNGSNGRVYSIYIKDFQDNKEMWGKINKYAKGKMYTERGWTFVFFFKDRQNIPDVTLTGEQFPKRYEKYCVAAYWKYPTGKEIFKKYPFK